MNFNDLPVSLQPLLWLLPLR